MAQAGIHAYFAFAIKNKLPSKRWFFISFLIGSILPDIDIILIPITSLFLNFEESIFLIHRTFTHSLISVIIIYLLLLIFYEIKKDKKYIIIANGFCLGCLAHIFLDIFLWFEPIHLLWPLPIKHIDLFQYIKLPYLFKIFLLALEFILFRALAWRLTEIIINNPNKNGYLINRLSSIMKIELFYLIIFIISAIYFNEKYVYYVFSVLYIHSLIMIIWILYQMRESINENFVQTNKENKYIRNKSSIQNLE